MAFAIAPIGERNYIRAKTLALYGEYKVCTAMAHDTKYKTCFWLNMINDYTMYMFYSVWYVWWNRRKVY